MMLLVLPGNEEMCEHLRHPDPQVRKFVNMHTEIEWPADAFTFRRIQAGDITQVGEVPAPPLKVKGPSRYPRKRTQIAIKL
jgi:hypothetical protein